MARAMSLGDLTIILLPLIDIFYHQADGCAGSLALEHARQNTDMVRLLPLRREFRRARPPLVKEGLDIRLAQRQTWRATVHDRARSEERRGGKECVSTCRSRGPPDH